MTEATLNEHMSEEQPAPRRKLLGSMAMGAGAVAAGALGGGAAASLGAKWKEISIAFDVACLGETWRDSPVNYAENESDFRGAPFSVEGWIYPAGTIGQPGDGFVPSEAESIGRWLCRGFVLVHAERPEPHAQTVQEYIFGPMSAESLFPESALTTSGTEGTATSQVTTRAVTGGVGAYGGATGEQRQSANGFNTSIFSDGTGTAPNFFCEFRLLTPDW